MTNLMMRNPMTALQREVDRLFENFMTSEGENGQLLFTPAADLWETDDHYVFAFDLPGLTKQDVEITYQDGMLQISGRRTWAQEEGVRRLRVERPHGQFFRAIRLDRRIDVEGIAAHFDNGVLMVEVPKAEEGKPKRIELK